LSHRRAVKAVIDALFYFCFGIFSALTACNERSWGFIQSKTLQGNFKLLFNNHKEGSSIMMKDDYCKVFLTLFRAFNKF
jgi:hypothetical protein